MAKFGLGLPRYEDSLFSTEQQRQDGGLEKNYEDLNKGYL